MWERNPQLTLESLPGSVPAGRKRASLPSLGDGMKNQLRSLPHGKSPSAIGGNKVIRKEQRWQREPERERRRQHPTDVVSLGPASLMAFEIWIFESINSPFQHIWLHWVPVICSRKSLEKTESIVFIRFAWPDVGWDPAQGLWEGQLQEWWANLREVEGGDVMLSPPVWGMKAGPSGPGLLHT